MTIDTLKDSAASSRRPRETPGVVVVFTAGRATSTPFALGGGALVLGRDCARGASIDDARMSREHVEISHGAAGWTVRDLGSLNGTNVDGRTASGPMTSTHPPVVRFGRTVTLAVADIVPFAAELPTRGPDFVVGPTLRAAMEKIAVVGARGTDLLLLGESGCGKEMGAQHFHRTGSRANGPFIAVNCAAIPLGIAERLLFGTVKGAYSGASAEAHGYVRSAEGGVLFLDEFGELDLEVQAKLLRVIETKEILPVGASRGRRIDVSLCLATNRDLRAAVSGGKFRSDLYYRVTQSEVALPPLRERREEIPWLMQLAVESEAPGLEMDAELVEACMLRPWPGNVRELLGEIRRIAGVARSRSTSLRSKLLASHAGYPVEGEANSSVVSRTPVTAEAVQQALREATSVAAAAQSLRIHRSHLYRLIRQFGIDMRTVASSKP
jgi:transcriptional regulator of acetoin/glycerol metabolism